MQSIMQVGQSSLASRCLRQVLRCAPCCQRVVSTVVLLFLVSTAASAARAQAVDFERQSIRVAMLQEPPSLNSLKTTDLVSFFVLGHTMEGLLRYDRRGRLTGGVAEHWDIR